MTDVRCFRVAGADIVETPFAADSLNELSLVLPQGVYTTFRTYAGARVLRLHDHLVRLEESAMLEGHAIALDEAAMRSALAKAVLASKFALARVRITLGLVPEDIYISLSELYEPPVSSYVDGVAAAIADSSLRRERPISKSTRFIGPAAAARAHSVEVEELLLIDEEDALLEGSSSNFFAVLEDTLRTASHGVLDGVTRRQVLSLADGLAPVDLTPVRVADIPRLREAFITSVSRAVLPVVSINSQRIGDGRPGPITRALIDRFAVALERDLEPIVPNFGSS